MSRETGKLLLPEGESSVSILLGDLSVIGDRGDFCSSLKEFDFDFGLAAVCGLMSFVMVGLESSFWSLFFWDLAAAVAGLCFRADFASRGVSFMYINDL